MKEVRSALPNVTATIHFGGVPRHLLSAALASLVIVSPGFAGELGALCSAAKDFVRAAKTQEGFLISYPTASQLTASTNAYASAKERFYSEFRSAMPLLIAIGLKQRESTAEIEEFRSVLRQFGPDEEQQIAKSTLEMLKQFDYDRAVAAAEKEFLRAQEIEAAFFRDFGGLDST